MNSKLKNYLHLHLIIFIWGFTAVLGKLITVDALALVWYRMLIASLLILIFIRLKKLSLKVSRKTLLILTIAGVVIMLHWVTFFMAIKVANVSIALATMSAGAFFTAFLEPLWYKRKMVGYEVLFGLLVMVGLFLIFKVETTYVLGIVIALISAFLASIFSLINGKLIQTQNAGIISFYELTTGVFFLSIYLLTQENFTPSFFQLAISDWVYLLILASVCTAYAFIAAVKIMKYISPYTVMLTINLEPVYGIILALLIIGEGERMNSMFYIGALIILMPIIANGIIKNRRKLKK